MRCKPSVPTRMGTSRHCWGLCPIMDWSSRPRSRLNFLVGAAELNVGLNDCGVVGLEEWVEELGDGDGAIGLEAIGEVLTGEDLGDGEAAGEGYDLGEGEVAEPLALPSDVGAVTVDYLEELVQVGQGVFADGLGGEHLPGGGLAAGVADLGSPVADDEDYAVAELLELTQFAEPDCVAEVDVGAAGVEPHLEAERFTSIEELLQLLATDYLGDSAVEYVVVSAVSHQLRLDERAFRAICTSMFIWSINSWAPEKRMSPLILARKSTSIG